MCKFSSNSSSSSLSCVESGLSGDEKTLGTLGPRRALRCGGLWRWKYGRRTKSPSTSLMRLTLSLNVFPTTVEWMSNVCFRVWRGFDVLDIVICAAFATIGAKCVRLLVPAMYKAFPVVSQLGAPLLAMLLPQSRSLRGLRNIAPRGGRTAVGRGLAADAADLVDPSLSCPIQSHPIQSYPKPIQGQRTVRPGLAATLQKLPRMLGECSLFAGWGRTRTLAWCGAWSIASACPTLSQPSPSHSNLRLTQA